MKNILPLLVFSLLYLSTAFGQTNLINVQAKKFKTSSGIEIEGELGYLEVLENRNNPKSRKLNLKYIRLKSIAKKPTTPLVYLEGGDGYSTWQAENPQDLEDWLPILKVSDVIFVDRKGVGDETTTYVWMKDYPDDFMVSEKDAEKHYQVMTKDALKHFGENNIDVKGYTLEQDANDIHDLMLALAFDSYSILGFSFGSHIGMTLMTLYPNEVKRAILIGSDAPNQALNYPMYLEHHIKKLSNMFAKDSLLSKEIPDFEVLVSRVMKKLEQKPVTVTIKNPLTQKDMDLKIGPFGVAFILRLDIDDANDIPVIPRLLYTIDNGDYSMLTWFAQKRMVYGLALPGDGINRQLASGASMERWALIKAEAEASTYGNVVNFPFSAAKNAWVQNELSFDPTAPLLTNIPTLFITGDLDCRTPVEQVEETKKGFENALHIIVENAGHEQAMWNAKIFDETIPAFLSGKEINTVKAHNPEIKFITLEGKSERHPSLK